jgi:NAD(P)-dependent dehydrogenase (short-subunit alcohol dehydrogenase family)
VSWTASDMPSLDGDVVVVTGANSGLGFEATKAFARKEATVIMACRDRGRGETAAAEIREAVDGADLDVRICNLAALDSVERFAEGVSEEYDAIDVLCNNAGVMAIPRAETEDGFEMQFGVNHLGHYALTGRLFDLLAEADDARVVTHSSGMHEQGEMDFEDLHWEDSYSKWAAYGRSKLANLLFAFELQRRMDRNDVASVRSLGCHPGYADTNLQMRTAEESGNPLLKPIMRVTNAILAQSPDRGVLPMLYAATADVDGGSYVGPGGFMDMRGAPELQEPSADARDEDDARRLWEYSREATGVTYPFEAE